MVDRALFLHIGLHKTGTTALQKHFFPHLRDTLLVRGWTSYSQLLATPFPTKVILSDEGIAGHPWSGGYLRQFEDNVDKLRRLHGAAAIIFGVRRQDAFFLSVYKQYLHEGGHREPEYLLNLQDTGLLRHHDLFWAPRIEQLRKTFSHVFVYRQETLAEQPDRVLRKLCEFIGAETDMDLMQLGRANESVCSTTQVQLLRRLNALSKLSKKVGLHRGFYSRPLVRLRITPRDFAQHHLAGMGKVAFTLDPDLQGFLREYYTADWDRVARLADA